MYQRDDKNDVHVSDLKGLPTDEHYAVITEETFSYEDGYDDGRGGRSSSTHRSLSYLVFHDVEKLQEWIRKNGDSQYGKKQFRVVRVKPVSVSTQIVIRIDE